MNFQPIAREPNDFQQTLSADEISALCQRALGTSVVILEVRELPSGMFNSTYKITFADETSTILRVSPDATIPVFTHEKLLLRREHSILPYLAPIAHLVPQTVMIDFTRQLIDRDYVLQTFLPGELWDEVKDELSAADTAVLWQQMAKIAQQIHTVRGTHFGLPHPELQFSRWSEAVNHIVDMMLADFPTFNLSPNGTGTFLDALHQGKHYLDEIKEPHLLHGDLWPKNVLLDRQSSPPKIVGLLDAERGFWGDPMAEWVFYYLDIPNEFWQVYGRSPQTSAAEFRQLVYEGLFAIQILLETTRFGWDETPFRERIEKTSTRMQEICMNNLEK